MSSRGIRVAAAAAAAAPRHRVQLLRPDRAAPISANPALTVWELGEALLVR